MMQSARLVLCGLFVSSCYGYAPQMAAPKAPHAPMVAPAQVPKMQPMQEVRDVPDMQHVAQVPFEGVPNTLMDQLKRPYMLAQPIAEEPATSFGFLGGLAGGFAAGAALVYSLLRRTSQKMTVQARKLTSIDVESPSVAPVVTPNSLTVEGTALAPYLAGGASLPAVLNQVTSGRVAMPSFGSELRAINIGQGRRVVVNMAIKKKVSPAIKKKVSDPNFCYGLPGGDNILGQFDPAGFLKGKDKLEVYRLREAELAHGRVGMLASLGFIVQENYHPLFEGQAGPAGDVLPSLPVWIWLVFIGGVGLAEQKRIAIGWAVLGNEIDVDAPGSSSNPGRALKEGYYPGDLGFDPLRIKPTDPEEFRLMQEKELSHCRLAMIAAAGFIAQESVSNDTWGAYWAN